jgi:2-polyprenyl-3-methyl-5-hydroxy-6-metoxy-1,4-benzoquinol methylase
MNFDYRYKERYRQLHRAILGEMLEIFPEMSFESSVPSYLHSNRLASWIFWKRIAIAFDIEIIPESKTVLDIGCGTGVMFKYFWDKNCSITGCDPFSSELAEFTCEKLSIDAEIYEDLSEIPTTNFDFIFALDVLEHVDDLGLYLERILEFSHLGTRIVLSGPTENLLYKIGRSLAGFSGDYHLRNIYEVEESASKHFSQLKLKSVFFPALFRVSSWKLRNAS